MIVGRSRELKLLQKGLKPGACVALVGASGVGKTEIAREAARSGDSTWVDCLGLTGDELAFRIAPESDETPPLADLLADTELLVLDDWNPEVSLDDVRAGFDGAILLTALVTPADVTTLPVQPFDVPSIETLAESEAFELFEGQADDVRLGASSDLDADSVHEIIQRVGGHPLGIALAARHAAIVGAGEVARLIREGVDLRDDHRNPRQRSLTYALDFSWQQLGPQNQAVLYLASRFERPVRVVTLAELAEVELADAMESVRELTQCGALVPGSFLRPVTMWREIGLSRFRANCPDAAKTLDDRIFATAVQLAEDERTKTNPGPISDAPSVWEAALVDYESRDRVPVGQIVRELLTWSHRYATRRFHDSNYLEEIAVWSGSPEALTRRLGFLRGNPTQHIRGIEAALEVAESDEARAQLHFELAMQASVQSDVDKALEHLATARSLGGTYVGISLEMMLLMSKSKFDEARAVLVELHELEPPSRAHAAVVAFLETWLLPPGQRLEHARRAAASAEDASPRVRILALRSLADVLERGHARYDEVRELRQEVLELAQSIDHLRFVENLRCELAWGAFCAGDLDGARAVDELNEGNLMAEVILRRHCVVAMLACFDGDLVAARAAAGALKREIPHVPPLHDVFEIVDAAIALDSGETWDGSETSALMVEGITARERSHKDQLATYNKLAALRSAPDWAARFAMQWLIQRWSPFMQRLHALESADARVVALADGSAFRVDGEWNYLPETSAAMLRVLLRGEPATFEELKEAAWPGEVVAWDSLVNRVSVRVSQLRGAGLKPVLQKTSEGFMLDCSTFVER